MDQFIIVVIVIKIIPIFSITNLKFNLKNHELYVLILLSKRLIVEKTVKKAFLRTKKFNSKNIMKAMIIFLIIKKNF